jgi:DNA-binding transcriptional LysR family regulator
MPSWRWPAPRNFRRAAVEQRVSVSSLSQRLRNMEERLGVRLMNRTTRSVALTEAGELLLARIGPALHDVGNALDRVRGLRDVPSGRLRAIARSSTSSPEDLTPGCATASISRWT